MSPEKAALLVKTMCVLHNYLRTTNDTRYFPAGYADNICQNGAVQEGFWRNAPCMNIDILNTYARRATAEATAIRNRFVQYFSSEHGSVPWQFNYIHRR